MKKPELQIIYENCHSLKNETSVKKWITVVYTRRQTEAECTDAEGKTRMFTKWGYFIDDKPWYGDIEKVLKDNFEAEANHVSEEEREIIRQKLREEYYSFYKRKPLKVRQLELF